MKINVLTLDKNTITLDVHFNHLVEDVKALLKVETEELLFDGKEMSNSDKLSELGVQEGDLIVVSDSVPISSSSTSELGLTPDGSVMNLATFKHEIQPNSNLVAELVQGTTNFGNVLRNGEGEASLAFPAEKDIFSHSHEEEKYSENEPVGGISEVNEKVDLQTNGVSVPVKENDYDHAHNSSDKESSSASIQKVGCVDHNEVNHFASHEHVDDMLDSHSKEEEVKTSELFDSSLSPSVTSPLSPNAQTTTKGHGLKKWRRIRREITKDPSPRLDYSKLLKRGSETISDVKKPNDGSASSTNAFVKGPGLGDLFSNPVPSSNYKVDLGTTFSAGIDDSEDRSSKSSTAASVPKFKHDIAKHKVKNVSGRHLNSSGQRLQLGKGIAQADASKKPRGESVNADKENSLSSMESDSRSYNSVFPRGSSVNSDQVQSGRSENYNEEDDYDHQASEVHSSKDLRTGHCKNGDLSPECSAELSCSANIGQSKGHQVSRDCEPLLNSILMLQSAQEALEREVQMFKEIGKGVNSLCDDSGKATGVSAYSIFVGPDACLDHNYGSNAEFNHAQTLERDLHEAQVRLKEKDLEVAKLGKIIKNMNMKSPQADKSSSLQQEMEAELENAIKLKVEVEVHYVVMTELSKDFDVLVKNQVKLLEDQNLEASRRLIADAGNTESILQGQAKSDKLCTDITEDEEIPKLQRKMAKYSSYLAIQLILLVIVVGLLLLRALPKSATVVPT